MVVVIEDPLVAVRYIQERRRTGRDHHDEVWEGVYLVSPDPNNEHQSLTVRFGRCALVSIEDEGLGRVFTGGNVSDQAEDWTTNFRCPDIAIYLEGGIAKDMGSHWLMGPDFAVEIVSRGDRSRDKFDFYAAVGTRELLIVDRYPWCLELYRLEAGTLVLVGKSTPKKPAFLASVVLPLTFQLIEGSSRPAILAGQTTRDESWTI